MPDAGDVEIARARIAVDALGPERRIGELAKERAVRDRVGEFLRAGTKWRRGDEEEESRDLRSLGWHRQDARSPGLARPVRAP